MVTDRQIRLLRDWDVIEPSELFLGCGSNDSGRTFSKADKNLWRREHRESGRRKGRVEQGRYDVLESVRCRCHKTTPKDD